MFLRMFCAIVLLAAIATLVLSLRQKQFEKVNELARLYRQAQQVRDQTWTQRMLIARELSPDVLEASLQQAAIPFESVTHEPDQPNDTALSQAPRSAGGVHGDP